MEGTCPKCGAPLVRQTDRRKARGYSLRCSAGGHSRPGGGPQGDRLPKRPGGPRRGQRPSRRPRRGTQHWMTDPTVRVCRAENCFNDAPCPEHGR